jgi:pimeloyl-ACP methyl ester carboxylesterase
MTRSRRQTGEPMELRPSQAGASSGSRVRRPSLALYLSEPGRSAADVAALLVAAPWLARSPRGDGHPVLVLPGLLATDASTIVLRRFLGYLGYPVRGWQLGRNLGPTTAIVEAMPAALQRLAERYCQPVSVIGCSLGGIYARQLARQSPDLVRQVITLGSPFAMADPSQSRAQPAFNRNADRQVRAPADAPRRPVRTRPLPVPATAIYSRWDGIVAWQTCREDPGPTTESVAVHSSHLGFGHNPTALWVVADRPGQDVERWRPFAVPQALRALYPADSAGRT